MRLSHLIEQAGLESSKVLGEAEVTSVVIDSRRAGPGGCFVAVRGWAEDGHRYIPEAVERGASAVVCEDPSAVPESVPRVLVADCRAAAGRLAQAIRGWPGRKLRTVGITGTNGKTTVAHMVREILSRAGLSPGLLGTIVYETGRRASPALRTTPDPVSLAEMCEEMVAAGRTHLVMEVSSHALDQRRTAGLAFDVGVFTNLSSEHLDYHRTLDRYAAAKRRLFEQLSPEATAVINADDPAGASIAAATKAGVVTYGVSPSADLRAEVTEADPGSTRLELVRGGKRIALALPLIGLHNVHNALAAAGAAGALGIQVETVVAALSQMPPVPGRLERVPGQGTNVLVDYAHTDDALENVLKALRDVTAGRVIVVFGCGGDRDATKRPRMAGVAEQLADEVIVTSDNPRTEDPGAIIEQVLEGFTEAGRRAARVVPARREAIRLAIERGGEDDVVLIAGKGHETYQEVGTRRLPFNDVDVAAEFLQTRGGGE